MTNATNTLSALKRFERANDNQNIKEIYDIFEKVRKKMIEEKKKKKNSINLVRRDDSSANDFARSDRLGFWGHSYRKLNDEGGASPLSVDIGVSKIQDPQDPVQPLKELIRRKRSPPYSPPVSYKLLNTLRASELPD